MQLQQCEGFLLRPDGPVISLLVRQPKSLWGKARGLMGSPPLHAHEAMLLRPCRVVTMLFMGYPILVVYLDEANTVLSTEVLLPWQIRGHAPQGTAAVLEASTELAPEMATGMILVLRRGRGAASDTLRQHGR